METVIMYQKGLNDYITWFLKGMCSVLWTRNDILAMNIILKYKFTFVYCYHLNKDIRYLNINLQTYSFGFSGGVYWRHLDSLIIS